MTLAHVASLVHTATSATTLCARIAAIRALEVRAPSTAGRLWRQLERDALGVIL